MMTSGLMVGMSIYTGPWHTAWQRPPTAKATEVFVSHRFVLIERE